MGKIIGGLVWGKFTYSVPNGQTIHPTLPPDFGDVVAIWKRKWEKKRKLQLSVLRLRGVTSKSTQLSVNSRDVLSNCCGVFCKCCGLLPVLIVRAFSCRVHFENLGVRGDNKSRRLWIARCYIIVWRWGCVASTFRRFSPFWTANEELLRWIAAKRKSFTT